MEKEIEKWRRHMGDEIAAMDEASLRDAFDGELAFGTGGIRGVMGPGPNRLNIYVIRRVTYGLGLYLGRSHQSASVVIAHDNRHNSPEFARAAAEVLSSFGVRVFLFTALRPTPELSFAVRHLHCQAGIVITASHNPREYNGYKVYDETGCQLNLEASASLIECVGSAPGYFDLDVTPRAELIELIDREVDLAYAKRLGEVHFRSLERPGDLRIVYTPLHGAGSMAVPQALTSKGYQVFPVAAQMVPDPDFGATRSANPEDQVAFAEALKVALVHQADLILATDPDADRIGVALKHQGEYHFLNGNQTGALLIDYVINARRDDGTFRPGCYLYNTVVTSCFGATIARAAGVNVVSTLTGFKFIGEQIKLNERRADYHYLFGYEESYGYLLFPFVRDKDSVQAALAIAEMVGYYLERGVTLVDRLAELQRQFGYFGEGLVNISLKGAEGLAKIKEVMSHFRGSPLSLPGFRLVRREDYLNSEAFEDGRREVLSLPVSDVLKFVYDDGSFVAVRPSGTEPKLKIYLVFTSTKDDVADKLARAREAIARQMAEQFDIKIS